MAFVGSETDLMTPEQRAELYRKMKNVVEDQRDDAMRALKAAEDKLQDREKQLEAALGVGIERGREIKALSSRLSGVLDRENRIKEVIYEQFAKGKCSEFVAFVRIEKIVAEELRGQIERDVEKLEGGTRGGGMTDGVVERHSTFADECCYNDKMKDFEATYGRPLTWTHGAGMMLAWHEGNVVGAVPS